MSEWALREGKSKGDGRVGNNGFANDGFADIEGDSAAAESDVGSGRVAGKILVYGAFRAGRADGERRLKDEVAAQEASVDRVDEILLFAGLGHDSFDAEIESIRQR